MAAGTGGKTGSCGHEPAAAARPAAAAARRGSGGMTGSGGTTGSGGAMSMKDGGTDAGAMGGAFTFTGAFKDGTVIDAKYRCDGPSPQMMWSGAPADAMSFAVILKDLTPGISMGFYHWVIYDIPKATTIARRECARVGAMPAKPAGAKQAPNYQGTVGYDGPCAPHWHQHVFADALRAEGRDVAGPELRARPLPTCRRRSTPTPATASNS